MVRKIITPIFEKSSNIKRVNKNVSISLNRIKVDLNKYEITIYLNEGKSPIKKVLIGKYISHCSFVEDTHKEFKNILKEKFKEE